MCVELWEHETEIYTLMEFRAQSSAAFATGKKEQSDYFKASRKNRVKISDGHQAITQSL